MGIIKDNQEKKMKSEKAYPFNMIEDLIYGENFNSELDDREVAEKVEELLQGLSDIYTVNKHIPEKMRTIIHLYYRDGMTYKEIGGILGITGGRVGQIKQRVLRILRLPSRLNRLILKESSD